MITVSGIAADGPPAADETRRIAAESVSPQHVAVMGPDTEKRLAVIPVILFFGFDILAAKVLKISQMTSEKIGKFLPSKC